MNWNTNKTKTKQKKTFQKVKKDLCVSDETDVNILHKAAGSIH